MLDCRLPHSDLPRGIHERTRVTVHQRFPIPDRICSAIQRRKPGLLGAIAVHEKPPRHRGKIIAEPALRPINAVRAQHLGQANENLLNSILDICRGERLINGTDEVSQGRRVKLDKLEPNRRVVAMGEVGDFLQERLWRFGKLSLIANA